MTRRHLLAGALGFALTSRSHGFGQVDSRAAQENNASCIAIEQVTVLSMAPGSAPQSDMTVLIEGERIARIEPAVEFAPPGSCIVVDGRGKWLMPGLFDMHAHFLSEPIPELDIGPEDLLAPYLVNGVQQIVDMAATPFTNAIRDDVAAGDLVAPLIASAAMIDGSPAIRPGAREVLRPEEARAVVEEIASAGFDFVKVYSRLEPEVFAAVLAAAEDLDIRVIGHLPETAKCRRRSLYGPDSR